MRLYYTSRSPENLQKAHECAPFPPTLRLDTAEDDVPQRAILHGQQRVLPQVRREAVVGIFEEALTEMPIKPHFVVLPDISDDVEATVEKHRRWLYDEPLTVGDQRGLEAWS